MGWELANDMGLETLHCTHKEWDIAVIPGLGGKISSIRWHGFELLASNPRKALRPARYAAPYADFDASGFDECFPTIGPCKYPEFPWEGIELPDHGELWSIPWSFQVDESTLLLSTQGVRLPYQLSKTITILTSETIQFHYTLNNPTPFPIKYIWSSHPLFAPQPGMRILLPEGTAVLVDWSRDARLGEIWQEHPWPLTEEMDGTPVDLSLILSPESCLVDKLYSSRLTEGWCAVYHPDNCRYLAFTFSPTYVPFVGLSINLGGWPVDEPGYYNLGIEPCSGFPDRVDLAIEKGSCSTIRAYTTVEWDLFLHAGEIHSEDQLRTHLKKHASHQPS